LCTALSAGVIAERDGVDRLDVVAEARQNELRHGVADMP
jgi:hypothetical protein